MEQTKINSLNQIKFEGQIVTVTSGKEISPGDFYLTERRNGEWEMLTCRKNDQENGWIVPVEIAYPHDTWRCHKILSIEDAPKDSHNDEIAS